MQLEILKKYNKSFHYAISMLPKSVSQDVIAIYEFCRKADTSGLEKENNQYAKDQLSLLNSGKKTDISDIVKRHNINKDCLRIFLESVVEDQGPFQYNSMSELVRFCYCSSATIGIMVCQVLGQTNKQVLYNAINLGIAIRLTKVARDYKQDLEAGKIYVPSQYTQKDVAFLAEYYFQTGFKAIPFLPSGLRPAIYAMSFIYRRLAKKIIRRNQKDQPDKVIVYFAERFVIYLRSLVNSFRKIPPTYHDANFHEPLRGLPFVHERE